MSGAGTAVPAHWIVYVTSASSASFVWNVSNCWTLPTSVGAHVSVNCCDVVMGVDVSGAMVSGGDTSPDGETERLPVPAFVTVMMSVSMAPTTADIEIVAFAAGTDENSGF